MSGPRKAPCVDVRTDVHKDIKFEVLGELAGYNRYEALGRMHALWSWCVDRGLQDAPDDCDGYVVSEPVVRRFLGANGVTALLGDGVDEFALGVRRDDGRIYLRGTSEQVAAARTRTATSTAGGLARAAGERDQSGRYVSGATHVQPDHEPEPSRPRAVRPAVNQPTPAPSSSSSSSEFRNSLPPRAIDTAAYALAQATWAAVSAARLELAAELKLENVIAMPARFGMPNEPRGCRDLRDRVKEEGDAAAVTCKHVIANLVAQAREERSVEWLSEKAFTAGGWQTARNWIPGQQQRQRAGPQSNRTPRVGAIGSSTPHKNHGDAMKPAKEVM